MASVALSQRVVDAVAETLERRLDRRGFVRRSALVGTALAVAPVGYTLRPRTAYAAICNCSGSQCNCGAQCCDGYTEFCCTITGRNACPPGTLVAGWWKVDGHAYCGGGPRYYMDCNAGCGGCGCGGSGLCGGECSGTPCGCANGSCGNRKSGCTRFRYGQCNQHVACVGPIVCRVVTCFPPWQVDPTCTSTPLLDNNTRFHDRPCLHFPTGRLEHLTVGSDLRSIRVGGWALDPDTAASVDVHVYIDGGGRSIGPANLSRPDVARAFPGYGDRHGFDTTISVASGAHTVHVYAINAGPGANVALGSGQVTVGRPIGNLETATFGPGPRRLRIAGWALDPDTTAPIDIHVYIDGGGRSIGPADLPRPDVGRAFPGYGDNHGFEADFGVSTGTHTVCVYAINRGGGSHTLLGCRRITVGGSPTGHLDTLAPGPGPRRLRIGGWALDPDTTAPIDIHVYIDGGGRSIGPADLARPDVGRAFPGYGDEHGFEANFGVSSGTHRVCVYAINVGPGAHRLLGCGNVSVE